MVEQFKGDFKYGTIVVEISDAGGGGGEPPKLNPEFFIMCL